MRHIIDGTASSRYQITCCHHIVQDYYCYLLKSCWATLTKEVVIGFVSYYRSFVRERTNTFSGLWLKSSVSHFSWIRLFWQSCPKWEQPRRKKVFIAAVSHSFTSVLYELSVYYFIYFSWPMKCPLVCLQCITDRWCLRILSQVKYLVKWCICIICVLKTGYFPHLYIDTGCSADAEKDVARGQRLQIIKPFEKMFWGFTCS